jgi:dodecin
MAWRERGSGQTVYNGHASYTAAGTHDHRFFVRPLASHGERAYHGFVPGIAAMPDPSRGGNTMAKKSSSDGVYRVTEVIGTSKISWEDAAKNAVTAAGKTLRDLRIAEVSKLDMKVEGGKVVAYRARVQLSFKYDG